MSSLHVHKTITSTGKVAVADGTSEVLTAVEDMTGVDEICFDVIVGDIDAAAVLTFAVKQNTASSTSSPSPTAVALTAVEDSVSGVITSGNLVLTELSGNLDNKIIRICVKGSAITARYVFLSITATVESFEIVAIHTTKTCSRAIPVTQDSDVVSVAYAAS